MSDDPQALAKLLLIVADRLEDAGAGMGVLGAIRRGAGLLATLPAPAQGRLCPSCGGPVPESARGRPRTYCTVTCRRRAENQRRNEALVP